MFLANGSSGLAVVWWGSVHLRCHIKLQLELLSAQRNSLLLALANHCWIRGILQCISNPVSNNLKPLTRFL
jgi:hypothetical protein